MAEKLTQMSVIKVLSEQRGKRNDELFSARVNHACYIIEQLTDDEINKVKSLRAFLENIGNTSCLNNPDADLCGVIKELEEVHKRIVNRFKGDAAVAEVDRYVGGQAKRNGFAAVFWTLLGIGVVITVIFAFLDNFNVIDYGGMAAGAAGIIDLAIGAIGCIVERVSDAKHTKRMSAAQNVDDAQSYESYKQLNSVTQKFSCFNTNIQIQGRAHSDNEMENTQNSVEQTGSWFNKNEQIIQDESHSDKEE